MTPNSSSHKQMFEQMFTNLDQNEILRATAWLCYTHLGTMKKKRYQTRSSYRDTIYVQRNQPHECTWQEHKDAKLWQKFELMDLIKIAHFDLTNTYTSTGTAIFKQIQGAPIGGFLSTNYANIKCAYDENNFHNYLRTSRRGTLNYAAIRQVDDLIAWAAYDQKCPVSKEEALFTLARLTCGKTYTGGLSLKLQESFETNSKYQINKFAGTLITTYYNPTLIEVKPFNKNWDSIEAVGKQKLKIYPHWQSYIPLQIKMGFITGTIIRFLNFSTKISDAEIAAYQFVKELILIGYPKNFICKTIARYKSRLQEDNKLRTLFLTTHKTLKDPTMRKNTLQLAIETCTKEKILKNF